MAEIRKHNPGRNAISDAIARAMGESVRPTTPGGSDKKPETPAPASRPDVFTTTTTGFTIPKPRGGEED